MILTYLQVADLNEALSKLDAKPSGENYNFRVGTRLKIVRNLMETARVLKEVESVRDSLIRDLSGVKAGPAKLESGTPEFAVYLGKMTELMENKVEVKLEPLSLEAFDLDKNAVPFAGVIDVLNRHGLLSEN